MQVGGQRYVELTCTPFTCSKRHSGGLSTACNFLRSALVVSIGQAVELMSLNLSFRGQRHQIVPWQFCGLYFRTSKPTDSMACTTLLYCTLRLVGFFI